MCILLIIATNIKLYDIIDKLLHFFYNLLKTGGVQRYPDPLFINGGGGGSNTHDPPVSAALIPPNSILYILSYALTCLNIARYFRRLLRYQGLPIDNGCVLSIVNGDRIVLEMKTT